MIPLELSKKILSIGPDYSTPRGGMAQVLSYYDTSVYEQFQAIANSCEGNRLKKLFCLLKSTVKTCWTLFRNKSIEIVHIHTASRRSYHRSVFFARVAKLFNRKVVMHIHGGGFLDYYHSDKSFVDNSRKYCDAFVALSENWKAVFEQQLSFNPVFVVNNVVPRPNINSCAKDNAIHLLFLGLITQTKGIYDLVNVVIEHHQAWSGKLVIHVGGNGEVEKFCELIKANHLDDIIVYEGWVSGNKRDDLFNKCDVFLLPSYVEGLPISILEAMSYGMFVISTRVGAIPSIVKEKENSVLIDAGNGEDLFCAIDDIVNGKYNMSHVAEVSKAMVKPYYPDGVATQLTQLYELVSAK